MKEELFLSAKAAAANAYAAYSGFPVGAAVVGIDGSIHSACNVENASFGLGICAERAAVFQMVASGCKTLNEVAVVTRNAAPPCGACLQVMSEFATNAEILVHICDQEGIRETHTLKALLPHGFGSDSLNRT